jgi:hypothetical protein
MQNNKTPVKSIVDYNQIKSPSNIISYIEQVPKNLTNNSPYVNQSNVSSIPPKFPKQHSYDNVNIQQNIAKMSKHPKGEEYEQSLIFASSKGTSRMNSVANSKMIEQEESQYFKSN